MSQLDIPVLMWILLSLFFFYKGTTGPKLNYVLAGIFFGLSLLSKIITGFLSPMIIFLYLIWEYFIGSNNKIKQKILGFSLFIFSGLIIALPWFIAITGKLGFGYWEQALGYHVFSRIASALETHSSPLGILYWPHQILLRLNVFFPFLIFGMFSLRRSKFMDFPSKILLWSWLLIPFTTFTFVSTKFHPYILTFIIPLVIFCAIGVYHYFNSESSIKTTALIIITSLSSLIWMQTHSLHRIFERIILSTRRLIFPELTDILIFCVFILSVFVAYYFLYRYLNNRRKKDYLKIASVCFICLVLFPAIVKNFEPLIQKGSDWIDLRRELTQEEIPVRKLIFNGDENGVNIFNMQLLSYTLNVSYESKNESIDDLKELENIINQLVKDEILIIEKSKLEDFKGEVENFAFIRNNKFLIIAFSQNSGKEIPIREPL
jgi:4-amino-4-deoxy-L-arabinose transferase-like glycosyltransferase